VTWRQFLHGVLLLSVILTTSGTTGDPDLWGHVRFGQDMLAAGSVRLADTYSFTTDRAWINHEWLAEVLMAVSFDALGATGLNLFRLTIVGTVLLLVWLGLRRVPATYRIAILSATALGISLRGHPIRPQLFSLLLFAVLLTIIIRADERRCWRPLGLVPAVMALWVNLHGGWIVGLGVLGLWSFGTAVTSTWRQRATLAAVLTAAFAATLLNPYGIGMWEFLATTVRVDRPAIADWLPTYALPVHLWFAWISACGIVALATMKAGARVNVTYLVIALFLACMSLRVSRLDAFFALVAAMLIAPSLGTGEAERPLATVRDRRSKPLAMAFAACVVATIALAIPRFVNVPMAHSAMPDAQVAAYVRGQGLRGTVLTWFDWGQYTIWHFGRDLKVSIDGRRETVYSDDLVAAHMRFYFGEQDAWAYADSLQPDYVWLPRHLPVTRELQRHGWRSLCEGSSSVLLTREDRREPCGGTSTGTPRSFPQL
jgi:hypothetical protein